MFATMRRPERMKPTLPVEHTLKEFVTPKVTRVREFDLDPRFVEALTLEGATRAILLKPEPTANAKP